VSLADCSCEAGYVGSNGGLCGVCAAGMFKSSIGSEECQNCATGQYHAEGESGVKCMSCNTSYFLAENKTMCLPELKHHVQLSQATMTDKLKLRNQGDTPLLLESVRIPDYSNWGWSDKFFVEAVKIFFETAGGDIQPCNTVL
jgi:hypothetical protein